MDGIAELAAIIPELEASKPTTTLDKVSQARMLICSLINHLIVCFCNIRNVLRTKKNEDILNFVRSIKPMLKEYEEELDKQLQIHQQMQQQTQHQQQ